MKKKVNKVLKKEEDSEEWCFVCKDGGDLIICDYKDCLKSYHPPCVDLDDSSAKANSRFICELHKCDDCRRAADVHCYGCPRSVCGRCIKSADFVRVKGKKGFCSHCLKLTLLVEENKDIDSDGERVEFDNRDTYETLYKEYWEIINADGKLTLEVLKSAQTRIKLRKNDDSESDEYQCSDSEEIDEIDPPDSGKKLKRSKPEPSKKKVNKKVKTESNSNKEEFTGWGSTRLIQFLTNIGRDISVALSQRELETIIKNYSKDKNLIQKKKTIECDEWLYLVFKRKTIKINRIFDSLETHLVENQVSSDEDEDEDDDEDEDEFGYDLEENDHKNEPVVLKKKKKNNGDKMEEKKEALIDVIQYRFASIVPDNIRLVYLRRSLVQNFAKDSETFESKVIGSFVRFKEDAVVGFSRGSYQLMQITGVKKCLVGENDQTFVLQALDTDIRINSLSDDDFSEEECQDLKTKVKSGILNKLELIALEEKARSLHKDIVSHWLPRELTLLKHRIDQANEKGRRKELFEYLGRKEFLQNPVNQSKLLEKVPTVVPDVDEAAADPPVEDDKKDSPKSILTHVSPGNFKHIGITSEETKQELPASETYEMAMKLDKFFNSLEKQDYKSRKPSVVKNPSQLFDFSDEKSTIAITKEELEDTESSQWFVTNPRGDKVGPVSLFVLKNWSQNQTASKSMVYKMTQTEEHAKPLTDVLRLAFPRK